VSAVQQQDKHFDGVADEYDESLPEHVVAHLTSRRVALSRALVPSGKVLDVGCGTGRFLSAMPTAGYELHGIDVSAGMLEEARKRGLDVTEGSSGDMPFADDSFDLAVTFAVLHHLIDPELVRATLREMVRVTKPGGKAVIWDHNPNNPYWKFLMARLPQDQGDEVLVPASLIMDELGRTPASQVSLRRMTFMPDFTPEWAVPVVARIEAILERTPLVNRIAAHNVAIVNI
jgi:ubiquinone/menaquinone biosynthesis C-methylase UbiE